MICAPLSTGDPRTLQAGVTFIEEYLIRDVLVDQKRFIARDPLPNERSLGGFLVNWDELIFGESLPPPPILATH